MSKEYQCRCGHIVFSGAKDGPGKISWTDGHVCRFKPVEREELNEHNNTR